MRIVTAPRAAAIGAAVARAVLSRGRQRGGVPGSRVSEEAAKIGTLNTATHINTNVISLTVTQVGRRAGMRVVWHLGVGVSTIL